METHYFLAKFFVVNLWHFFFSFYLAISVTTLLYHNTALIFFVGGFLFLRWLFGSDHKSESPYKYKVKQAPSQLPPINYDVEPNETLSNEECFLSRRGEGEVYDSYYRLCEVIQHSKSTAKRLAACEESYDILPAFVRANLRDCQSL